ncbi:MAG: gluconate 2-dehydrogenase subunit 3 family protein [Myxococcota bacterium]
MPRLPHRAGFSPDETRGLSVVLDEIIPGREGVPGAGALGLASTVEEALAATAGAQAGVAQGLASLDELSRGHGAGSFAELPGQERREVLNELAAREPGFLPGLIFHTYVGYYQDARVVEALGLEPRPPHPEGYELEAGDLSLLDPVRERAKMFRKV